MSERDLSKGYVCECGKYNQFSVWVHAHLHVEIRHTCECGRTNILLNKSVIRTVEIDTPRGYDRASQ
jgi:hypothetical protein